MSLHCTHRQRNASVRRDFHVLLQPRRIKYVLIEHDDLMLYRGPRGQMLCVSWQPISYFFPTRSVKVMPECVGGLKMMHAG